MYLTLSRKKGKSMLRKFRKILGGAIAVMCLVSTMAMASEMTCAKDDGKGTCTAATGPDGQTLVVVGEGLKVGEIMDCMDRGNMVECQAVRIASTMVRVGTMTCAKDDGKGTCTAATGPDGQTIVVVGEGLKAGEIMDCMDRGNMVECQAVRMQN
jgi:hypothetical protein